MTHEEAIKELAVERYLLGELSGEARNRFEAHLFDCLLCTSDVKDGVLFLEGTGPELQQLERSAAEAKTTRGWAWLWRGWVLGPALAACLTVIVYQSAVVLPGMRAQLAQSQSALAEVKTPSVLTPLLLANAGARGGSVDGGSLPEIVAPRHGFYLLSVDVPSAANVAVYRCTLYSPAGDVVWRVDVSPRQARDTVTIQVPAMTAQPGINQLRVEGIPSTQGKATIELANYKYKLNVAQ